MCNPHDIRRCSSNTADQCNGYLRKSLTSTRNESITPCPSVSILNPAPSAGRSSAILSFIGAGAEPLV
jgi:hypothetical protein